MIKVQHLTKYYGQNLAVDDISFEIQDGQVYGFLGPNGAGKSTTMNIMTGCLAATAGEVKIGGYDIFEEPVEAKKLIGYLPELPPLYPDRTPREYLRFVAEAKGVAKDELTAQLNKVMEVTRITEVADRLIKNLSKGYKQRVGIAQALLGEPKVIILDEPTVGLDPVQIIEIRDLIKELGREHTVILSSHILSEVQAVCETVLIISKGKLVACDTTENLEKHFAAKSSIELTVMAECGELKEVFAELEGIESFEITDLGGGKTAVKLTIESDAEELCKAISLKLAMLGKPVLRMDTSKASLEDIFIELTSEGAPIEETPAEAEAVNEEKGEDDESGI